MPEPRYAHDLMEEALFFAVAARRAEEPQRAREWERQREAAYAAPPEEREETFRALAASWWKRLDLEEPLRSALASCPALRAAPGKLIVRRVARRRDEGCQLYSTAAGGDSRTVLHLRAERFAEPRTLCLFALEELLYADDMLRPGFGYRPQLPVPDEDLPRREALRERLRALWSGRNALRARHILGLPPRADALRGVARGLEQRRVAELTAAGLSYDALLALAQEIVPPAAVTQ